MDPKEPDVQTRDRSDVDFEEIELPDADAVTLGNASYTKMLGRIYAS